MKSKTTIELNGRQYDAITGTMLSGTETVHAASARTGRNIDGFFRGRTSTALTVPRAQKIGVLAPVATPGQPPRKQPSRGVNHAHAHLPQPARTVPIREHNTTSYSQKLTVRRSKITPNHVQPHAAQNSKILMRKAVKKPNPSFHKQAGTTGALQHAVPSLIVPKLSAASIDEGRLARAQTASQSPLIAHHGATAHKVEPFVTPLAVKPQPVRPNEVPVTTPAPAPTNKPDAPVDIFEHALANASHFVDTQAHKKHFKKKARRHFASVAAGSFALLLIAGFATYQNTPGLQFKIASIEAGVTTTMPNLNAAGFAYTGTKAANGKLTVGFSGASGNYQLTQQTTNLSDTDMINSVGSTDATGTPTYRTIKAGSTNIYRLSNTTATWISNGKWYTVTGTGALTDNQVESLVSNV